MKLTTRGNDAERDAMTITDSPPYSIDDYADDELIALARKRWCLIDQSSPGLAGNREPDENCPPQIVEKLLDILDCAVEENWSDCGVRMDPDGPEIRALAAIREALK